jgi:putative PIN family toxin of toxin-antitoxin system
MRVVVGTNVVVSAILRDRNPERAILHLVGNPECEWIASEEILAEYREVLRRPRFGLAPEILGRWDERFRTALALWPVNVPVDFPRDQKDAKFLACMLASQAEFLLTGDRDFEEAKTFPGINVISVSRFVTQFCKQS